MEPTALDARQAPADPADISILLACCRKDIDGTERSRIVALAARVEDWDAVVGAARSGGTAPLLYRGLAGRGLLPAAHERDLRAFFSANALRGNALVAELKRIGQILDNAGIAYIPYKGPALALAAYGDVALRQFEDLDIHLRERDVIPAGFALIAHGYRPLDDVDKQPTSWPPRSRRQLVHVGFADPEGHILIELQSRFGPSWMRCGFDYDGLWQRTRVARIDGAEMRVLSNEDLLLVLAVHAAKHCWERLEWVAGIAEIVRSDSALDWESLVARAARDGTRRILFVALHLAADLMAAPLPDRVRDRVNADRGALRAAADARRWLLYPGRPSRGVERIAFNVRTRERWFDALACAFTVTAQYVYVALYYPRRRSGPLRRTFAFLRRLRASKRADMASRKG